MRYAKGPDRGPLHIVGGVWDQGVMISPVSGSTISVAWFCSAIDTHQRGAVLLADGTALVGAPPVDLALDVEQGVETLHRLEGDRVDRAGALTAALLAGGAFNIGEFEKLAARMGEAACFEHRSWPPIGSVELAKAAIGIGLEDAGPVGEVRSRMASRTKILTVPPRQSMPSLR